MDEKEQIIKLECLAYVDEMTGLNNRNFYFCIRKNLALKMIKDLLNSKPNERQGIWSILFCDVNNLKYINDTLGHHVGDAGLAAIANIIKNLIRRNRDINDNIIASQNDNEINIRFGGDEFLIILPNCRKEDALLVKERLKNNINNNLDQTRGLSLAIGVSDTASITLDEETKDDEGIIEFLEKLIKAAEENMYDDKLKDIKAMPKENRYELLHKFLIRLRNVGIDITNIKDIEFLIEYLIQEKNKLIQQQIKRQ